MAGKEGEESGGHIRKYLQQNFVVPLQELLRGIRRDHGDGASGEVGHTANVSSIVADKE